MNFPSVPSVAAEMNLVVAVVVQNIVAAAVAVLNIAAVQSFVVADSYCYQVQNSAAVEQNIVDAAADKNYLVLSIAAEALRKEHSVAESSYQVQNTVAVEQSTVVVADKNYSAQNIAAVAELSIVVVADNSQTRLPQSFWD